MTTDRMSTDSQIQAVRDKMGCFGSAVGIAACSILFVFALLVFGLFGKFNGTQKTGVDKETKLSATYADTQNELSAQILKIKEALGVVDAKSAAMDQILKDAVSGRYQQGNSANGAVDGNAKLFSAVVEAYPDLKGLDSYDKVIDTINSGREAFKNKQSRLADETRAFKSWLNSGFIDKTLISMVGFPDNQLEARVGSDVKHGQAALDQISTLILDGDTTTAYTTGTQAPLITQPPRK